MAVYKRSYRAYTGRLTPEWSRFYILTRYALRNLFRSKFLTAAKTAMDALEDLRGLGILSSKSKS